jgi:hypothetical protein
MMGLRIVIFDEVDGAVSVPMSVLFALAVVVVVVDKVTRWILHLLVLSVL